MGSENGDNWSKTAVVVIDMQVLLCLLEEVKLLSQTLSRPLRLHETVESPLFGHLYGDGKPKPTSKGGVGAELVDGLVIQEGDYKLVKTRFSAFFDTNLHSYLQGIGVANLVVIGVQTPNCIRQTVFDAVALDYQRVTVIIDATAAATPDIHIANIFDMKNVGVATPTLEEWCQS